ncbi:hypothetical protein [Thalassotalea sp. Y01]|uniref:hypothetical protein n=1 Tax=Thalassotalea sp. Y01 TaxID=2729613 RepID=UPI00145E1964|nr:hypothetical protein [Thalassotalea sp. Y01]NMP16432.1 hypothetical protein [Thalassotalea sp. Y01]
MDNQQHIYQACTEIAKQGKTPSIALIKARVAAGTPLALIIKGLQTWQKNPKLGESTSATPQSAPAKAKPMVDDIEQRITSAIQPLQQQINDLKQEIAELKAKS